MVGYGRVTPEGKLPVFSVDTEEQAKMLIIMTCPRDMEGNHYARELAREQTLENLALFSDKIQTCWDAWQSVNANSSERKRK